MRDDPRRVEQIVRNHEIGTQAAQVPLAEFLTLPQMLERCVFVERGRRVAVLPESAASSGQRVRLLTLDEFVETYMSSGEKAGEAWASYAQAWRRSPQRKSVADVALGIGRGRMLTDPSTGGQALNLWTPRQRPPPTARGRQAAGEAWKHLEYLVPDAGERVRFRQWLGHCEQRPEVLPHHGILMITETFGIGRNWFASVLSRVWKGEAAAGVNLQKLMDSDFNGSIAGRRFVVIDECFIDSGRSRYAAQSSFREIITAEQRTVNPKYGREYVEWNALRWLLFSNHWNAMPLPEGDRRMVVIANPTAPQTPDYYARLYNMLEDEEMIDAVAYDLAAATDLTGFNPGAIPEVNDAKRRVIDEGQSEFERDLRALLVSWAPDVAAASDVMKALGEEPEGKAAAQFGPVMRKVGWVNHKGRVAVSGKRERIWVKPGAAACDDLAAAVKDYRKEAWFKDFDRF